MSYAANPREITFIPSQWRPAAKEMRHLLLEAILVQVTCSREFELLRVLSYGGATVIFNITHCLAISQFHNHAQYVQAACLAGSTSYKVEIF